MKPSLLTIITSFFLLFACYHTAEFEMLLRNSPAGFLLFSGLFFLLVFFIARWQDNKTLHRWDFLFKKDFRCFF